VDARLLLEDLASRGIHVEPRGEQLVVEPASTLTDNDRDLLRQLKPDLLELLTPASRCAGCSVPLGFTADPDRRVPHLCSTCGDTEMAVQRNPRFLLDARSLRTAWAGAVFELGELAGFPALPFKPAHTLTAGEHAWRRFVASRGVDDLRSALDALRSVVATLPLVPGSENGAGNGTGGAA
jgi:hypothetical protein